MTGGGYGPDVPSLDALTRKLEQSHDDSRIRDALGRTKPLVTDAESGNVEPAFYYRLSCGHIITVWSHRLPEEVRDVFCEHHPGIDPDRARFAVVEHLTDVSAATPDPPAAGDA